MHLLSSVEHKMYILKSALYESQCSSVYFGPHFFFSSNESFSLFKSVQVSGFCIRKWYKDQAYIQAEAWQDCLAIVQVNTINILKQLHNF